MKHNLVENMSSGTADALGLSRAILCNGEIIVGFFICRLSHLCESLSRVLICGKRNVKDGDHTIIERLLIDWVKFYVLYQHRVDCVGCTHEHPT